MCGWNGDSESESYNLVRDTLYSGNETAYQISTVTAAVCGGAGKWLGTRAAKAAEAAAKKAAEEAAGLADETAEAAAKTAAKEAGEAAEEAVKQSTKYALEDAAGETAIENLDGIEGIGKSGTNSINSLDDLLTNPNKLSGVSGEELYNYLVKNGYDVKPINRGRFKGIPFEEGGGFKVNWGGDRILQYHPENLSHHGGAYFKISSGETGTIRIDLDGNLIN